jgi:hypothetical protein
LVPVIRKQISLIHVNVKFKANFLTLVYKLNILSRNLLWINIIFIFQIFEINGRAKTREPKRRVKFYPWVNANRALNNQPSQFKCFFHSYINLCGIDEKATELCLNFKAISENDLSHTKNKKGFTQSVTKRNSQHAESYACTYSKV